MVMNYCLIIDDGDGLVVVVVMTVVVVIIDSDVDGDNGLGLVLMMMMRKILLVMVVVVMMIMMLILKVLVVFFISIVMKIYFSLTNFSLQQLHFVSSAVCRSSGASINRPKIVKLFFFSFLLRSSWMFVVR